MIQARFSEMIPKNILITGSNRGIGLEFVKQILALKPQILIATCRNPDAAFELKELQKSNNNLHILKHDMSQIAEHAQIAKETNDILKGEGLNMLINNAGVLNRTWTIAEVTGEEMMADYMTNCVGPTLLVQAMVPLLEKASTENESAPIGWTRSIIVNISTKVASIEGNGMGGLYPYRASKTALNMVTKNLSIDLAPKGILCVILHPGHVSTDMGTSKAPTTPQESISGMLKVLESLGKDDQCTFRDFKNEVIPW